MKLYFGSNDSLTVAMSDAADTTNPTYTSLYFKGDGGFVPTSGSLSGTTAVTLVPAASATGMNRLESLFICNVDAAAVTLTVSRVVSGTSYTLFVTTLAVSDTLIVDDSGYRVVDSEGQSKGSADPTELAGVTAGTVAASKAVVVDSNKDAAAFRTVGVVNLDAGSSGVAGTVDVFPTTASKGKLAISCTDQTGDTTAALVMGAQAAARTYTIADATTAIIPDNGCYQHVTVTSANSAHLVTLPTPTPGTTIVLHVGSNGYKLRSSTPASIAINGGTGASASSTIAAESTCFMTCVSATSWKGYFLDADSDVAKVAAAA